MATGGTIQYGIKFNVDNNSLNQLKQDLKAIQNITVEDFQQMNPNAFSGMKAAKKELIAIKNEAAIVQSALNKAFNADLGTTNLNKFGNALKSLNLTTLYQDLSKLGPVGERAFRGMATELLTANNQLRQSHKLLDSMAVSLKNTIKWGISSSVFNNFTGSIQKAWEFSKALDSSLNDIRIVSGKSADEMERFAKEANKAAKSLGASTLDYTKAALIYYQQGLPTDEVEKRTDVTLKMANVLNASAQDVSSYMTAIWNNFAEGTTNLEHFADVITALGAATAASSEEIATGLQKFAAVADTVGLSYEYATTALATVVAQTRQSADTVGTAFKTLFARIQDLELGNTLDDGTTLGQYAVALQKVGINIKDTKGELKDMNTILDEMGLKWKTLSQDEQVALAQNVAGTRQYTQLVALMDNWDKFKENLNVANNATGTLQKQQDTYMQSTEAHLQKLGAAAERVKNSLVDKQGINSLIDGLTSVTTLFANFAESLGGGRNLLLMLGSVGTQVFGTQIASSLATTINNLNSSKQAAANLRTELMYISELKNTTLIKSAPTLEVLTELEDKIIEASKYTSQEQVNQWKNALKEITTVGEQAMKEMEDYWGNIDFTQGLDKEVFADELQKLDPELKPSMNFLEVQPEALQTWTDASTLIDNVISSASNKLEDFNSVLVSVEDQAKQLINIDLSKPTDAQKESLQALQKELQEVGVWIDHLIKNNSNLFTAKDISSLKAYRTEIEGFKKSITIKAGGKTVLTDHVYGKDFTQLGAIVEKATKKLDTFDNKMKKTSAEYEKDGATIINTTDDVVESMSSGMGVLETKISDVLKVGNIKNLVEIASGIGQVASAIQSLKNIGNILDDKDLSTGEKILQVTSALGTSLAILTNAIILMHTARVKAIGAIKEDIFLSLKKQVEDGKEAMSILAKIQFKKIEAKSEEEMIALRETAMAGQAAEIALNGAESASNLSLATTFGILATSIWTALAPILPFVAAGAALVGAIALVVKEYNKDADAAKKAQEAAKDAADAAALAKERYDNLFSGFDKYDSAVKTLEDLELGTKKYAEALKIANEQAMELIRNDASLAQYAKRNGQGLIYFEGQGDILAKAKSNMNTTQALADVASVRSNEATLRASRTQSRRDLGLDQGSRDTVYKIIEPLLGGFGPIVTGLYKVIRQDWNRSISDEELEKVLETINNNSGVLLESDLKELGFLSKKEIETLTKHSQELEELAKNTKELNETNKLLIQESLRNSLEERADFAGRSDAEKNAITALYGNRLTKEKRDEIIERERNGWYNDHAFGWGNEDDVHRKYAELKGWTVTADHWGDTADYVDISTGEEHKGISDDAAREYIINWEVQNKLADYDNDYYKQVINTIDKISSEELDNKYGANFTDAILGAIGSTDKQLNLDNLFAQINPKEYESLLKMSPEDWKQTLGLTDEDFNTLGLDSAESFKENFKNALENYEWSARDAVKASMSDFTDEDLNKLGLAKEEFAEYSEHLMDVADKSEILSEDLKYDADAALIVAQSVMRMNNGIETLSENFEDWSDILKKSDKSSEEYSKAFNSMQKALADLLDTEEDIISDDFIQKHFDEIEKAADGDTEAIKKLHKELAKQIIIEAATNFGVSKEEIDNMISDLDNLEIPDIKVGATLDTENLDQDEQKFMETMQSIIRAAGMTADEANALFGQMGFQANFKTEQIPTEQEVPEYVTETIDEGSHTENGTTFVRTRTRTYQDGTYKAQGKMTAIAMETTTDANGNEVKTPIITGITKKGTAAMNNSSSKNPGGKKSSGSKKSKEAKSDDKFDRYHQVNTQIAKVEKSLQRLENTQKKVLGSDLLKNLNNQWKNLNTQIKNYNDKLKIAYQEQNELKKKLSGQGVKFNSDGTVSNYMSALENAQKEYNKAVDKYNKSKQKDADKKKLDAAKKKYEEFKTDIDRYDEMVSSFIPEILQQIRDVWDKQVENSIEQFHIGIDLAVDIKDIKLNWADFRSKVVNQLQDSDILGNVNLSKERTAANMENAEARRKQLNTAVNELQRNIAGNANLTGDDRQKAIQEVKDNYEAAMQLYTELAEERNNAEKLYQQALEQEKQALQDQLDLYNQINAQLEHDKKLVELVYGTKAYDKLVKYDKQQDANNKEQLKVYKAQEDVMKRRFEEAKAERDRAKAAMEGLTQGTDAWQRANSEFIKASENLSNAQTNYEDAMTQANQALEQSIESLHKTLEDQAEELAQSYGQQVTGMAGELEYAQDEWDLINKHADQYLDTINRLSGENQLESRYLESIEKATSPSIQKKLKDAMDSEMKYLREKDKLSQYDLDRANKKLQVTLAQIALEEAQDNKSTMRLRRDSQGNYRYQYVADEDNVKKAEEDLQKARVDLYNFDKERMKSTHNDILALEKDFRDKLKEIETNSSYSEEERAERLKLIYEEYYGEDGYLPQAYELANTAREKVTESAFEDLAELQGKTLEDFTSLTKTEQDAIMTGLIPAWDSVASHMAEAGAQAELMLEYMNALKEIQREYQNNVAGDLSVAGQSTEDLANGLDEKTEGIQGLITPISQVVDEQNKIVEAAKAWTDEINTQIGKLDELLEAIENAKSALLEFEEDELEKVGIAMGFNRNDSHYKFTDTVKSSDDFSQNTDFQQFLSLKNYHLENGITDAIKEFQRDLGFTGSAVNGIANKTLWTAAKMAGFSSGGYTGDWGSTDGRIGILHEKELVLNAKDTENILEATYAMRQAMLSARANSISSSEIAPLGGDVLEQNVHIEATFPNATSANEIEEALRNLVNAAAQRRRSIN